jgi:hypothetical protein
MKSLVWRGDDLSLPIMTEDRGDGRFVRWRIVSGNFSTSGASSRSVLDRSNDGLEERSVSSNGLPLPPPSELVSSLSKGLSDGVFRVEDFFLFFVFDLLFVGSSEDAVSGE